jgi:hypothetical protein
MYTRFVRSAVTLGLAISATAAEADSGWSVDAGATHTDNATLVETGKKADTLGTVGGSLAWEANTQRLEATLNGAGEFLHYFDNSFRDDFQGRIGGHAKVGLVPELLSWTVDDHFGQVATNPFAAATPANLQNLNVFSSGPDLHLRLGDQMRAQFSGRYEFTRYESTDQINTRSWNGSIGLLRDVSPTTSLGVLASMSRYTYDASGVPTYDQQGGWIEWKTGSTRQTLSVDAGGNRVSSTIESRTEPLARIKWHRRLQPFLSMDVQLSSEFMNAAQQFTAANVVNVGISTLPASARKADVSFVYAQPRTRISVGGGVRKLAYDSASQPDEKGWNVHAEIGRQFTPRVQGFVNYRIDDRDYGTGLGIRERTGQAGLDWQLSRAAFLTISYSRLESGGGVAQNRYDANLLSARLSWRSGSITPRMTPLGY